MNRFRNLSRREMIQLLSAMGALQWLEGCRKTSGVSDGHKTKDLTNSTSITTVPEARIKYVVEKYKMASWVDAGRPQADVFENLATVPDVYLAFLLQRANEKGFRIMYGGQAAGMCWFDNVGALKITLNSASFATIHEVGHGVEFYAHKIQKKFSGDSMRDRVYAQVLRSPEQSSIRAYAKSNSKELWADGFSSFYRSPKARDDLRKMPVTWKWLSSVLVCPVNLGPNEDPKEFVPSKSEHATKMSDDSGATPIDSNQGGFTPDPGDPQSIGGGNQLPPNNDGQPVPSPQPRIDGTAPGASDPCAGYSDNQLMAILCQLASQFAGSGGLGLGFQREILLPLPGQLLTANDRYLVQVNLDLSLADARMIEIFVDDKPVAHKSFQIDMFDRGAKNMFSTFIEIPESIVHETLITDAKLSLKLKGKTLLTSKIRLSKNSPCGELADFTGGGIF